MFETKNIDKLTLILATCLVFGFFVAGLFDILDSFIIQFLLFLALLTLMGIALFYAFKNKKNRLEDEL